MTHSKLTLILILLTASAASAQGERQIRIRGMSAPESEAIGDAICESHPVRGGEPGICATDRWTAQKLAKLWKAKRIVALAGPFDGLRGLYVYHHAPPIIAIHPESIHPQGSAKSEQTIGVLHHEYLHRAFFQDRRGGKPWKSFREGVVEHIEVIEKNITFLGNRRSHIQKWKPTTPQLQRNKRERLAEIAKVIRNEHEYRQQQFDLLKSLDTGRPGRRSSARLRNGMVSVTADGEIHLWPEGEEEGDPVLQRSGVRVAQDAIATDDRLVVVGWMGSGRTRVAQAVALPIVGARLGQPSRIDLPPGTTAVLDACLAFGQNIYLLTEAGARHEILVLPRGSQVATRFATSATFPGVAFDRIGSIEVTAYGRERPTGGGTTNSLWLVAWQQANLDRMHHMPITAPPVARFPVTSTPTPPTQVVQPRRLTDELQVPPTPMGLTSSSGFVIPAGPDGFTLIGTPGDTITLVIKEFDGWEVHREGIDLRTPWIHVKRPLHETQLVCLRSYLFNTETTFTVGPPAAFKRGDANGDGTVNISDMQTIAGYLFNGTGDGLADAYDVNDDGVINMTDVIYLANHLFQGGGAPPAPFSRAGQDTTPDTLAPFLPPPSWR